MEKQAVAVREQQWYQTITTAKQSGQSMAYRFPASTAGSEK